MKISNKMIENQEKTILMCYCYFMSLFRSHNIFSNRFLLSSTRDFDCIRSYFGSKSWLFFYKFVLLYLIEIFFEKIKKTFLIQLNIGILKNFFKHELSALG